MPGTPVAYSSVAIMPMRTWTVGRPLVVTVMTSISPAMARIHPDRGADRAVGSVYDHRRTAHHSRGRCHDHRRTAYRSINRFHIDRRGPADGNLERYTGVSRCCIGGRCDDRSQGNHMFGSHNARFDAAGPRTFENGPLLKPIAHPALLMVLSSTSSSTCNPCSVTPAVKSHGPRVGTADAASSR